MTIREIAAKAGVSPAAVSLVINNKKGVSEETVQKFMRILEEKHISVTRRREMGDDIEGACGQLRRAVVEKTVTVSGENENAKV